MHKWPIHARREISEVVKEGGRFWSRPPKAHQVEIWEMNRVPTRSPRVCTTCHLDARPHWPEADLLQTLGGCVNRRRDMLNWPSVIGLAFWNGACHVIFSQLMTFNPTPASSLSFFLFTHSFTVYYIHVLLFYLSYRIPSGSFGCQVFLFVKETR